jgi:hypothetical protein
MNGLTLRLDQTPCRASYGLLTNSARLEQTAGEQRQQLLSDVAEIAAEGDRMARAYTSANSIPEIASEKYSTGTPPDVFLKYIDRPIIDWQESAGSLVNIFA